MAYHAGNRPGGQEVKVPIYSPQLRCGP